ncbi:MAG: alpha/beta fold hydrolase [Victivallaceae bacterium]|nr:alpha/beta fold hydrolase [Victivallaceae bacterium]
MINTIIKYLRGRKCHFYFSPLGEDKHEVVVMVHGLIRRSINFYRLGRVLQKCGYHIYLYDYQTSRHSVAEHGQHFKAYLEKIATEHPDKKIDLVTHSMGGILTREALGHLAQGQNEDNEILTRERFKRIIMIAPPHLGSDIARLCCKYLPFVARWVKPLADLSSAPDAYIHQVPIPAGLEIGIIIGRFDNEVKEEYTQLPGVKHYLKINAEHSFIMHMPATKKAVISFLGKGHF